MAEEELNRREIDLLRRELELLNRENQLLRSNATHINFRDVEDTLPVFENNNFTSVEKWLENVEESSKLYNWTEFQMLMCAKHLLRGTAKLWLNCQSIIKDWGSFKSLIIEEFGHKVSSASIHQLLRNRTKKNEESFQEYILVMSGIASQANVEEESIVQYIIDGIQDKEINKTILYGAQTLKELKKNLGIYEVMKSRIKKNDLRFPFQSRFEKKEDSRTLSLSKFTKKDDLNLQSKEDRCFGCGNKGHKLNECVNKVRGMKCFSCNNFGHIASKCPNKEYKQTSSMQIEDNSCFNKMYKDIKISGTNILALIDTGSTVNLITVEQYFRIGAPLIKNESKELRGLGATLVKTKGYFKAKVEIDNNDYYTTIHVVADSVMPMKCIIGNELLKDTEITISTNEVKIMKKVEEETIWNIAEQDGTEEFNLENIQNQEHKENLRKLIQNYKPNKTEDTKIQLCIRLKDQNPIAQNLRRLSPAEQKEVETQIEDWLQKKIIQPSSSEFSSPIVLVKKKNGATRICIDYRRLNRNVIRDHFPLPLIEDQLDKLEGAKVFSTIDLRNGFFHVPVEENSRKYTAFVTPTGQYEFLRTPFGFCNSPAVFQRYIYNVFQKLIKEKIIAIYLDDVIVLAKDEIEGLERLKLVFSVAEKSGLEINWKKCQFLKSKIEYLGYEVENGTISPSKEKIKAVMKFPEPENVKQIQSFLGLTGYFRKFIENYSLYAKPLSDLTKKDVPFKMGIKEKESFVILKEKMSKQPILNIYQQYAETELHTDACKFGIGAILLQRNSEDNQLHPVYFYSKKTSAAEQNYTSYELEVLAIVCALKKFRIYLQGVKFKIITDCSAFQMTLKKQDLNTRIARWALYLENFDYDVEHRLAARMKHVDALSRNPVTMLVDELIPRIRRIQEKDEKLKPVFEKLKNEKCEDFILRNGILYKCTANEELLVIPRGIQTEVIQKIHEIGHFGVKKTKEMMIKEYWIPKMEDKIKTVIENCVPCILAMPKTGKQECLLNSINKNGGPLHTYHIDHLGPLSVSNKNYKYLFIVIDGFTKFSWIFPTKSTTTKEVLDKLQIMQKTFGNPERIISDRGPAFTSNDFKEYCQNENIKHVTITTGVPRGNGQVERIHRIIVPVLTKLSLSNPSSWYKHVNDLQRYLNSTYQRSIDTTPFELMLGIKMNKKEDIRLKQMIEEEMYKIFEKERDDLRKHAKKQIAKISLENQRTYNRKRKEARKYEIGDLVAIKRTQYGICQKLNCKYFGPYRITAVKFNDRYDVEKIGPGEGPVSTTSSADFMKPWPTVTNSDESDGDEEEDFDIISSSSEANEESGRPSCRVDKESTTIRRSKRLVAKQRK